jgi:ParB-like chromosome segregation protein Spo0J
MQIEYTPVRELRPHLNNARTHSQKQIRQIANSIEKFGFCNPVLIDDSKHIIAGHGRVEAAKLLGIDAVPTCLLSHLSETDKRVAYVLADNKLAEKAGWDRELLAIELQGLTCSNSHYRRNVLEISLLANAAARTNRLDTFPSRY